MDELDRDLQKQLDDIQPQWKVDKFDCQDDYEEHYVKLVRSKVRESENWWKSVLERWAQADRRLSESSNGTSGRGSEATSDLPMVPQAVEESIAVLVETLPHPTASPRQSSQDDFVGALNYFMEVELDANDFDIEIARVALDMKRFNLGVLKQSIDPDKTGPFGQPHAIVLKHVDPRNCYFDPFATGFAWGDYRYLIVKQVLDLSDVKRRWSRGKYVTEEAAVSRPKDDLNDVAPGGRAHVSEVMEELEESNGRRRVCVYEMWLKDDRLKFVPDLDETGAVRKDMNGREIGAWEPMFPGGRLIIVAGDVVLADQANPFRHKQPPYTFFPGRIQGKLISAGDVELLGRIEDKINRLHKAMYSNALVNMNSPWIVDRHAFDSPEKFKNITQKQGLVLPITQGARIERLPPAELPQFVFPFLDWLKGTFDDILGIREVQRGQIAQGAQLSAEALGALQGAASARIRLKSRLFENSLKHMGHLLQWNIRQFYPSKMNVQMTDPSTQEPKQLLWDDSLAQPDYAVDIEAGSSLPGSKQTMSQLAITLKREGMIGNRRALNMMELPGADAIAKERMDEIKEIAQTSLEAALKKGGYDTGARGRKPQSVKL